MKNFLIIVNASKDPNLEETKKICSYVEEKGGSCRYVSVMDGQMGFEGFSGKRDLQDSECILVLGGDGTLIWAAREAVTYHIPLIGINMGTLGYLCELEVGKSAFHAIDQMMQDSYIIEERMMLSGMLQFMPGRESNKVSDNNGMHLDHLLTGKKSYYALNDIVFHRTGPLSLVILIVYVNGKYLNTFQGDGVILSTPTGSTGYNMSAGGPIVDPKAKLILLTPINAHMFSPKSIVLDAEDEITIEIGSRRIQKDEMVEVSFDGDTGYRLPVGGRVQICRAGKCTKILKLSEISFLEILRKKMQAY